MDKQGPPPAGFAPPPPYSAGVPPPQQAPPVIIMSSAAPVGPTPTSMTCPHCHASITTSIETSTSTKTHLFFLLLCIIGCWPCAPCVYCADSCLVKQHYCPNCHKFIGSYDN